MRHTDNKRFLILTIISILLSVAVLFPTVIKADSTDGTFNIPANTSMDTVWNPLALSANYLTSYYIKQGDETVFHGTVTNYSTSESPDVIITASIYNQDHQRMNQVIFYKFHFAPFEYVNFEMISSRSLPPGQYYYTLGIYDAASLNQIAWYPGYQSFTVAQ